MTTVSERLEAATVMAEDASEIARQWANGPENTTIPTESGPLPTLAEFMRLNGLALSSSAKTISHFKAFATTQMSHGKIYIVSEFFEGTGSGYGIFKYDQFTNKSLHDGACVYAPESIVAWNGQQANMDTILSWSGSGSGCLVRLGTDCINVFSAGSSPLHSSNHTLINRLLERFGTVYGDYAVELPISAKIMIPAGKKLVRYNLSCSNSFLDENIVIEHIGDSGETQKGIINCRNTQRSGIAAYNKSSGILCRNVRNCKGSQIKFVDLGNKIGTSLADSFAILIDRSLAATDDVYGNKFSEIEIDDSSYRLSFFGRIRSDFSIQKGVQGFECYDNSIQGVVTTGGGFNGFEIVGPDTYLNTISDVVCHDIDVSDCFDIDHGAYLNEFENCIVKSVRSGGTRTQHNICGNKETVSGIAPLNRTYSNTFNRCGIDDCPIPTGKTVRVFTNLYGDDVCFQDPKITNVDAAMVSGTLVAFAALTANNVPTQIDNWKIINPEISYCTWLFHLPGSGSSPSGYVYNNISIRGGSAVCDKAVETSTTTAWFSGVSINDFNLEILGGEDTDCLRFPNAVKSKLISSHIKGETMTGRLLNMGSTSGSKNIVELNIFESKIGSTGSPVSVSLADSVFSDNNIFINRTPAGKKLLRYGNNAYEAQIAAELTVDNSGLSFFNSETKCLKVWDSSAFRRANGPVAGSASTRNFYATILTATDIGFEFLNTDNNSYNVWNGTNFVQYTGTVI